MSTVDRVKTGSTLDRIATIIGGESLKKRVQSPMDLVKIVLHGLPYGAVLRVSRYAGRTAAERTRVTGVIGSRATLERRARDHQPLSLESSERIERVARLTALAEQVLESHEDAVEFMHAPHRLLGSEAPIELARTDLGARQVEDLLWKLEYSLPV